jgi:CubicO group peptidase (beta-lactamase class C family)
MRSGLDNQENYSGYNLFTPMVRMYYGNNLKKEVLNAKIGSQRGRFNYQSINTQVLGMIVERATGKKLQDYLQEKIWQPLGMQYDATWSLDSKRRNTVKAFAALNAAPLDFAKLGRLFLNNGKNHKGEQIISEQWVKTTTNFDTLKTLGYKNQWWATSISKVFDTKQEAEQYKAKHPHTSIINERNGKFYVYDNGKAYMAEGILHQFIYVRPDKNLIIVRNGDYPEGAYTISKTERYSTAGFLGFVSDKLF